MAAFTSFALINELCTEFVADPPCEAALARPAFRHEDGEFVGNVEMLGDDLYTTRGNVGDGAVARQRTRPELDFGEAPAHAAFALASICKHFDPYPARIADHLAVRRFYRRIVGICLVVPVAIERLFSGFLYRTGGAEMLPISPPPRLYVPTEYDTGVGYRIGPLCRRAEHDCRARTPRRHRRPQAAGNSRLPDDQGLAQIRRGAAGVNLVVGEACLSDPRRHSDHAA